MRGRGTISTVAQLSRTWVWLWSRVVQLKPLKTRPREEKGWGDVLRAPNRLLMRLRSSTRTVPMPEPSAGPTRSPRPISRPW